MSEIPKLKTGQVLYRPLRRRNGNPVREIEQVTVGTVGTKYFTIEQERGGRYARATLQQEGGYTRLHLTSDEITDEWARVDLQRRLVNRFSYEVLPLDTLRQVEAILSPAP